MGTAEEVSFLDFLLARPHDFLNRNFRLTWHANTLSGPGRAHIQDHAQVHLCILMILTNLSAKRGDSTKDRVEGGPKYQTASSEGFFRLKNGRKTFLSIKMSLFRFQMSKKDLLFPYLYTIDAHTLHYTCQGPFVKHFLPISPAYPQGG